MLWLFGLVILLIKQASVLAATVRHVKQCHPVTDPRTLRLFSRVKHRLKISRAIDLRLSEHIYSPASFGLFRPVILLPHTIFQLEPNKLKLILEHELVHHKRFDLAFDGTMAVLKSIQWFNPLIWIAHYQMRMDCELACDQYVIRNKSTSRKKEYAQLLIQFATKHSKSASAYSMTSMSAGFNQLAQRVSSVSKEVTSSVYTSIQVILLALLVTVLGQISPAYSSFTVKNMVFDYSVSQGISDFARIRNGQPVSLINPEKKMISGLLTAPSQSKPYPALILVHGCEGFDHRHSMWAKQLTDMGIVTLRIQRQGLMTPYCKKPIAQINTITAAQIMDAYAALDFLKTLDYVDKKRISIMSWESWSAIGAAAKHGVGQVYLNRFHSAIAMYPDCTATYNGEFNSPLLIMVGESDQWAQAKDCLAIEQIAEQNSGKSMVRVKIYPDTYHGFDNQLITQAIYLPYAKNLGNMSAKGATAKFNQIAYRDAKKQIQHFLIIDQDVNESP